jgi:hypothetical protein
MSAVTSHLESLKDVKELMDYVDFNALSWNNKGVLKELLNSKEAPLFIGLSPMLDKVISRHFMRGSNG